MDISVRAVLACERADIVVNKITLVGGLNEAGKTSLLRAVRAAATGDALPVDGMTKAGSSAFIRDGHKAASARIETPEGVTEASWPDAQVKTSGTPIRASGIAVGSVSIVDMPMRDRAGVLAHYIKGQPSREDLVKALQEAGIKEPERKEKESEDDYLKRNAVERVWRMTQQPGSGWDDAWARAKELGVISKREFEKVTRAKWGEKQSATWVPQGWTVDLGDELPETLEAACKKAQEDITAAAASAAVSQDRIDSLKAKADTLSVDESDHETAVKAKADATAAVNAAEVERGKVTKPGTQPTLIKCPCCSASVEVKKTLDGFELIKPGKAPRLSKAEIDGINAKIAKLDEAVAEAQKVERIASGAVTSALVAVQAAREARVALDQAEQSTDAGTGLSMEEARAASQLAEQRRALYDAWIMARSYHATLVRNQAIVAVLAPEGLRKTVLGRRIAEFNNDRLGPICAGAGWRAVEITPDMAFTYGGRSYGFLSASAQWRLKAAVSIACAVEDKSQLVILDGVDILDKPSRRGLYAMLLEIGIPALIGCTYAPGEAPDLGERNIGATYFFEDGIAKRLGAQP